MARKPIRGGWKKSLANQIKENGKYASDGRKVVSFATTQTRREALFRIFKELRELGYKIQVVENIKGKHVIALANFYVTLFKKGEISSSTIRNRFSHLNIFCKWVGKPGLVKPIEHYIPDEDIRVKRSSYATASKTWSDKGVNPLEKFEAIRAENERIADALHLQLLFGLRFKESVLIQPHHAELKTEIGSCLEIKRTKGGPRRTRIIPIRTAEQRQLLDKIKSYIGKNESLIPTDENYENFRRQYYRTLEKYGINRKEGITGHGLRHEHLNNLYEDITGAKSPVHGGSLRKENAELDDFARQQVAFCAGHTHPDISSAYIGPKKSLKSEQIDDGDTVMLEASDTPA